MVGSRGWSGPRRGRNGILVNSRPLDFGHRTTSWAPFCVLCDLVDRPRYHTKEGCTLEGDERSRAEAILKERRGW